MGLFQSTRWMRRILEIVLLCVCKWYFVGVVCLFPRSIGYAYMHIFLRFQLILLCLGILLYKELSFKFKVFKVFLCIHRWFYFCEFLLLNFQLVFFCYLRFSRCIKFLLCFVDYRDWGMEIIAYVFNCYVSSVSFYVFLYGKINQVVLLFLLFLVMCCSYVVVAKIQCCL